MPERMALTSRNSCSHWLEERCSSAASGWRSMECISAWDTSRSIMAPASRRARARLRRSHHSTPRKNSTPATMAVRVAVPPRAMTRL